MLEATYPMGILLGASERKGIMLGRNTPKGSMLVFRITQVGLEGLPSSVAINY